MGVSINVSQLKPDYSYLFQSMSGGSSSFGTMSFLTDYASVKNGSYGKLMKAYYGSGPHRAASKEVSSIVEQKNNRTTSAAKDSAKTLSEVEKSAENLKKSADTLTARGAKSVFKEVDIETKDKNGVTTTTRGYDTDAIYKAVSNFVDDYNTAIKQASSAESTSIQYKAKAMAGATSANEKLLSQVGITINDDKTLSVDEKAFKAANMTTVKTLFNGNASYADRISAQATMLDNAANLEATKASTYNGSGSYNSAYTAGSLYDYGF
ncbi:MAG: hypothetical protein NC400_08150 [Clostridium sp.]|nr:hypothetical protein [Clostridium sp.]